MNSAGNVNGENEARKYRKSKASGVNEMLSAAMKEEEGRKKKEEDETLDGVELYFAVS